MTISRKLTSITTAIALAAASLGTVTTVGQRRRLSRRRRLRRRPPLRALRRHDDRGYRGDHGYRGGRDRYYGRHKKKNNTGKYVAIGAAALMLGIIASEASRR